MTHNLDKTKCDTETKKKGQKIKIGSQSDWEIA